MITDEIERVNNAPLPPALDSLREGEWESLADDEDLDPVTVSACKNQADKEWEVLNAIMDANGRRVGDRAMITWKGLTLLAIVSASAIGALAFGDKEIAMASVSMASAVVGALVGRLTANKQTNKQTKND